MARVSAVQTKDYSPAEMRRAVELHIGALGLARELSPDTRVTLKPNLLFKCTPESGVTTHPALVKAVVQSLQELGVRRITIADSPGGPFTRAALRSIYEATGMARVARETGAILNEDTGWSPTPCRALDGLCREFSLINPVAGADMLINLPKLKTHMMTGFSAGVKNLFGCVPGLQKPELHFRFPDQERFCEMLLELSTVARASYTIVDAVVSMEGDGPSAGSLRQTGMTFGSADLYALDLALCLWIGRSPQELPTVRGALQAGLCCPPGELAYLCDGAPPPLADFRRPSSAMPLNFGSNIPQWLRGPLGFVRDAWLTPRPVIDRRLCVGCGKCAESCPARVIALRGQKAYISPGGCIRCYCCHEMCPVRAVEIRRSRLMRW